MAKFPSQRKLHYKLEGIDDQTMTSLGYLNLPKDLSIVNRRGYASTTRKGVPLIFRAKVDFYIQNHLGHLFTDAGGALASAYNADMQATLKLTGAQSNWVNRNAAVKWHAAREEFFKRAGITKRMRGAYAHEIRYNLSGADDTWLAPIDGDGNAFTGGTWDVSTLADSQDSGYQLKLVGDGLNETAATGATVIPIGDSYLKSRMTPDDDSNEEASIGPAKYSHLNDLLVSGDDTRKDDTHTIAQGEQDNLPYDVMDFTETAHDITESVELGRAVAGMGAAFGSMIVDIPFGLCDVRGTIMQHATQTDEPDGFMAIEVLDIFEMQG